MTNHPNRNRKSQPTSELLGALKDVLEKIDFERGTNRDEKEEATKLLIRCRNAIAKAEGR